MKLDPQFYHLNTPGHLFKTKFAPELQRLVDVLEQRLLPVLNNDAICEEAKDLSEAEWERCMALPGTGDGCPSDFVGQAEDVGASHWEAMNNVRQSLLNLYAPVLLHAWEQQLSHFWKGFLQPSGKPIQPQDLNQSYINGYLAASGIDLTAFSSWQKIYELRLVANTVKHAAGRSCDKLKRQRPELFTPPCFKGTGLEGNPFTCHGNAPLTDADFYLTLDDLKAYLDALLLFWKELEKALPTGN